MYHRPRGGAQPARLRRPANSLQTSVSTAKPITGRTVALIFRNIGEGIVRIEEIHLGPIATPDCPDPTALPRYTATTTASKALTPYFLKPRLGMHSARLPARGAAPPTSSAPILQQQTLLAGKRAACLDVLCGGRFSVDAGSAGTRQVRRPHIRGRRSDEQVEVTRRCRPSRTSNVPIASRVLRCYRR